MNEPNVSTFYILDLDRTLYDTVKATELMKGVIALHDTTLAAALEQRFEEYTSQGESFSMRDFIVENVGEEEMQKIEPKYHELALQQDLLNPGATELIEYIRAKEGTALGILTYGSPLGQAMKIAAAKGLEDIPYLVTSETFKGALIASWRQDDDLYHIPEELGGSTAKNIVFVDDKPFSFKGLPIDCRGYLVKSVYDAGIEKLPPYVAEVNSLTEVLAAEKKRS
ncbi:MAG TPA: HAD family hydrolase [Candidatus Microsaccharimonas sp.]